MKKGYKKGTLFGKPRGEVIKHPGSETRRAKEHGKSLHEQAEEDSKSPDKHIRGKGQFALNAHKIGKKAGHRKSKVRARTSKKAARKKG